MATAPISPLVRYVRHVAASSLAAQLSDSQLLERFVSYRDEAAFAALVRRHGPLVLGVCRRLLRDWHLAQDCCQITFLILARKAGSLRKPDALGPWLHGVAVRTACKARSQQVRRRLKESQVRTAEAVEDTDDVLWRDIRPMLDEAVNRLAEKYRLPFVLHYLQGMTVDEVARRLSCPRGSVATRLARAKQQLRTRLVRRGVSLSAAGLIAGLSEAAAPASMPASLVDSMTRAATSVAAGQTAGSGILSVRTAALAKGVFAVMQTNKIKIALAVLFVSVLLGAGAGVFSHPSDAADTKPPRSANARGPAKARRDDTPPQPRFRFLSLAEARAIALERGEANQPSLLFPGVGVATMVQAPPGFRPPLVLADPNPEAEGILVIHRARNAKQAELERNVNQVLLNVEVAYWNLYGSYWQLHSREQGLRLAYETWKIAEANYKVGRVGLAGLAQAQGQYELFRSQRLQALDTVHDNEGQLRAMLGIPVEDKVHLVPADAPTLVEQHPDWQKAWNVALKKRPELRLARADLRAAEEPRERDRARLIVQDQELKTERFLGLYFRRMSSAYAQIKAGRSQRESFATQLRVREEKYRAGGQEAALDLLLESQRFWADALATEFQAITTYNNAIAGWEYGKGTILAHAHVTLAEEAPAELDETRAVEYEQKKTRERVRQEAGILADSPLSGSGARKARDDRQPAMAPSLSALWKSFPPLRAADAPPTVEQASTRTPRPADVRLTEWEASDLFPHGKRMLD